MLEDIDDNVEILTSCRDNEDREILEETGVDGSNIVSVKYCITIVILMTTII